MPVKSFYRFSYYSPSRASKVKHKKRSLLLHQLRDADAALELAQLLYLQGYQYGGLLLNYPTEDKQELRVVDESFLKPDDLLLITGRPPLDDREIKTRKVIGRSHTALEERVFSTLRRYFRTCARSEVTLTSELTRLLPWEARQYQDVQFSQYYDRADIERLSGREVSDIRPRTTTGYLVFTRTTWPGGPGLLCAFGMGGQETLLWAYLLRTRFQHLVGRSEFVMAEIVEQQFKLPKDDLSFADEWGVRILADIPLK